MNASKCETCPLHGFRQVTEGFFEREAGNCGLTDKPCGMEMTGQKPNWDECLKSAERKYFTRVLAMEGNSGCLFGIAQKDVVSFADWERRLLSAE